MIYLNGKTEKDYKANYIHWECTPPEPKMEIATVPLRDGAINLTSMLSDEVHFGTRTVTVGLELRGLRSEWPVTYSQILRDLHGRSVTIGRSEDPNWTWEGWASVGPLEDHGASAGVTITATVQPYKVTDMIVQTEVLVLSGDVTRTIHCSYQRGFPTFVTDAQGMTVTYKGETWTLPVGASDPYGLHFEEGDNEIALHGAGNLTITVKGGSL